MKYRTQILGSDSHGFFWRIFLVWASVGLLITGLNINIITLKSWPLPGFLLEFFTYCLLWGDFLFMVFASLVLVYVYRIWIGLPRTLVGLFLIAFCGAVSEWVGTKTGFPFGDYHYTENMGPMIDGQLPWAIPLAWWIVVSSLHLIFRYTYEALGPWTTGLLVGVSATLFDFIMEPYAWQIKAYWIWHQGSVPLANYITWFVLSATFSIMLNAIGAVNRPGKGFPIHQPAVIMTLMTILFLLGRAIAE
ncbi:MAG: carotenoid biosynthesis protein [Verrucomicrobiota bacterium]